MTLPFQLFWQEKEGLRDRPEIFKVIGVQLSFFKIGITKASYKEAGAADSAMNLLIMSAMIGTIVPGSFSIRPIHVGTGSKPHALLGNPKDRKPLDIPKTTF